jgi:predicted DNA-binding ribbon-helix-helix protein
MCRIFAEQDPATYRQVTRSIRIGGHSTSIRLEAAFWEILNEIAKGENLTTGKFISRLYDEATESNLEIPNFASMLRTTCTLYLRARQPREAVDEIAREARKQCAAPGRRTALRNI